MTSKKYTAAVMTGLIIVAILVVLLFCDVAPNIERQRAEQDQEEGTIRLSDLSTTFAKVYGGLILLGIFLPLGLIFLFDF